MLKIFKTISLFFLVSVSMESQAISYNCKDGDVEMIFNIDKDSLHFMVNGTIFVLNHTNTERVGNDVKVDFVRLNAKMVAVYSKANPRSIVIHEYRSANTGGVYDPTTQKFMWSYKCQQNALIPDAINYYYN